MPKAPPTSSVMTRSCSLVSPMIEAMVSRSAPAPCEQTRSV